MYGQLAHLFRKKSKHEEKPFTAFCLSTWFLMISTVHYCHWFCKTPRSKGNTMHDFYALAEELENLIGGGESFDDALAEVLAKYSLDTDEESDLLSAYDEVYGSLDCEQ